MIGRGMVTDPGLARAIKGESASHHTVTWQYLLPFIADFWHLVCSRLERRQQAGRLKQWLNFLRRRYPEAEVAYMALRTVNDAAVIDAWLAEFACIPSATRDIADEMTASLECVE
jgi:tRNA-dihydrouridine synthase C